MFTLVFQVNSLQVDEKGQVTSCEKIAIALLNTLDSAFKTEAPDAPPRTWTWDPDLRQRVIHILQTHEVSNVTLQNGGAVAQCSTLSNDHADFSPTGLRQEPSFQREVTGAGATDSTTEAKYIVQYGSIPLKG
jgi:hypothetical protein